MAWLLGKVQPVRGKVLKTIDGVTFELDLRETIDASLYYAGSFEAATERAIARWAAPGGIALDIGANTGYHTFRLAHCVGREGRVIALEPMTPARVRLERNMALNPRVRNITISAIGISDRTRLEHVAFQSTYRLDGRDEVMAETIQLMTVDDLVRDLDLPRVDFMKIDVDGFEGKVIRGARDTLASWRPAIVFEISPMAMREQGDDARELVDILTDAGYTLRYEDASETSDLDEVFSRVGDFSINLLATSSQ